MKNIFLSLFAVFSFVAQAQITQTIRGSVTDKDTKAPLIGANVVITSLDPIKGAAVDVFGNFSITDVPIGRIDIKITYMGYKPRLMNNVELTSGKELIINIELLESLVMDEVKVEVKTDKKRAQNKMTSVSARTFSIDESMRYAGSLNDVARMAQNFAGVQGADDSRNDIVIRGNSPTGVLYRIEGVDIPNPNHFAQNGTTGGPVSILNNNILDNSDFMTGAFPAEYGNALAGVFDIKLRSGNNQKYEFLTQLGFNGLEFMAEGPINKKKYSSFLISYRYSTLKLFQLMGMDFGTGTSIPNYQDLSFKMDFPNQKGKTSIWGIGGISSVELLDSENEEATLFSNKGEDLRFNSNIGVAGITNVYRFNNKSFLKTVFSVDGTFNEIQQDTLNVFKEIYYPRYRNTTTEGKQSLNLVYQNKLNPRNIIKLGIYNQRRFYKLKDSLSIHADTIVMPDPTQNIYIPSYWYNITDNQGATYLLQPFIQWQFRVNEKLTFNTGVHSQYFILNKTYAVEPRLGMTYDIGKKTSLSLAYGLHNQLAPNRLFFRQIKDNQGNTILDQSGEAYIPNRDLKMIRSNHFVLGLDQSLGKHSRIKAEAYYQLIDNAPVQDVSSYYSIMNYGANFDLTFPDTLVNNGTGTNYGMEVTVERFLNKGFYYLLTASLYESKYKGSDGVERNTAFNGNYTSNFLIGKEFNVTSKKHAEKAKLTLVIDAKVTLNGGQRYIPIDTEASKIKGVAVYDYANAYVPKYDDYFRTDFKIGFKRNGKKMTQEWSLNMQNFTNHKNVFNQSYNADTQKLVTNYQNGFLPVMQYKILF